MTGSLRLALVRSWARGKKKTRASATIVMGRQKPLSKKRASPPEEEEIPEKRKKKNLREPPKVEGEKKRGNKAPARNA